MKHFIILSFFALLFTACSGNNKQKNHSEQECVSDSIDAPLSNFNINSNQMIVNVKIDSIEAPMLFDTGGGDVPTFDSLFLVRNNFLPNNSTKRKETILFPLAGIGHRITGYTCNDSISLSFGDITIKYSSYKFADLSFMNDSSSVGIFNMPANDSNNVWELNFENNYITTHPADSFTAPDSTVFFHYTKTGESYYIELPTTLINGKDTLTNTHPVFIDTGAMYTELTLFPPAKEIDYINSLKKTIAYRPYPDIDLDDLSIYYSFKAKIGENIYIEDLKLDYKNASNYFMGGGLIGMDFLRRFNVYFDMKKQRIGLLKHNNYKKQKRTSSSKGIRLIEVFYMNKEGNRYFIKSLMKGVEDNLLIRSGLELNDEIVSINGYPAQQIYDRKITIWEIAQETGRLEIKAIRNGQEITLSCDVEE